MPNFINLCSRFNKASILFVMASPAEFGSAMRATGITPLFTGIGLIHAAIELTAYLQQAQQHDVLPDYVINIGTAGAHSLPINQIFEVRSVRNADMDVSALGFPAGTTPYSEVPPIITLPNRFGFPAADCYSTTRYDALVPNKGAPDELEDMELAAFAAVCLHYDITLSSLKIVSNNDLTIHNSAQSWESYCISADAIFADALISITSRFNLLSS